MTRQSRARDMAPYDTGEWVDVGRDGRWRPSVGERIRALMVIGLAFGALFLLAALASVDDGDGSAEDDVATGDTTTEPSEVATTTTTSTPTTTAVDAASLAGDPPPEGCEDDARDAAPLRERSDSVVLVLNGTPRNGHAGVTTDQLKGDGYGTIVPGNASGRPVTLVEYTPGFCAEGARLVDDLGVTGAELAPLAEDSDVFLGRARLLVTLGSDSL